MRKGQIRYIKSAISRGLPNARELVAKFNRISADPLNKVHAVKQREKWAQQTRGEVVPVPVVSEEGFINRVK